MSKYCPRLGCMRQPMYRELCYKQYCDWCCLKKHDSMTCKYRVHTIREGEE